MPGAPAVQLSIKTVSLKRTLTPEFWLRDLTIHGMLTSSVSTKRARNSSRLRRLWDSANRLRPRV
jgi:hypothetical protein